MRRRCVPICLFLAFIFIPLCAATAETLEEYKERMQREQEDAENDKDGGSRSSGGGCLSFGSLFSSSEQEPEPAPAPDTTTSGDGGSCCSGAGCVAFNLVNARYADYPYAPNRNFDFSTMEPPKNEDKFWMGELSVDGSYLFGQELPMYDVQSLLNLEVTFLHVNLFFQHIRDAENTGLTTFSANVGFSLPIQNFMLSIYAGVFLQEGFPPYVSFGASMKIFTSGNIIISFYSLFAFYDPFFFMVLSPTVELALDRFTLGIGYNMYDYNRLMLSGPTVKAGIWF